MSFSESEYIAATSAVCQTVWFRLVLIDLGQEQVAPTKIYCDNKDIIIVRKNPAFHRRPKHIETPHHFIRKLIANGEIKLEFCGTNNQGVDLFTKFVSLCQNMVILDHYWTSVILNQGQDVKIWLKNDIGSFDS